jgi:hypothetical protein
MKGHVHTYSLPQKTSSQTKSPRKKAQTPRSALKDIVSILFAMRA